MKSNPKKNKFIGLITLLVVAIIAIIIGIRIADNNRPVEQPADAQTNEERIILSKKIFLIIYDPILPSKGSQKLTEYKDWVNPYPPSNELVSWFRDETEGQINYTIAQTVEHNETEFIPKEDGFTYTEQTYLDCLDNNINCHSPDYANYNSILSDNDICGKVNRGEIDEVWLWGGPWFGFFESRLAGPNAFYYNSSPITNSTCNKLVPIMGFNYERSFDFVPNHSYAHRVEATMDKVYGGWQQNSTSHNWEKFGLNDHQSANYDYSGCGSVHFPPNGTSDYNYSNQIAASTFCNEFDNYPNINMENRVQVDCNTWGCTETGYLDWWYSKLPRIDEYGPDGKFMNWWLYIVDPNLVLSNQLPAPSTQTPTPTATQIVISTPTATQAVPTPTPTILPPNILPQDLNSDSQVDIRDFAIFRQHYLEKNNRIDFDNNGSVDIEDFINFAEIYKEYN